MLPSEHLERDSVIAVGAWFAGLVCAGNLLAAGRRILVLEAEEMYLAGEFLHSSSVEGAIRGGELAAQAVLGAST